MDRTPITENKTFNLRSNSAVRRDMGRMKTLDADTYMQMYPGYTFFWKEQNCGDVDRWLGLGAELVAELQRQVAAIKGYESRKGNTWVCRHVGKDQGGQPRIDYLMMMSEALYYEVKLAPEAARNAQMRENLTMRREAGEVDGTTRGDSTLKTYAPNLVTGGVGFEQEVGPLPEDA